MNNSILHAYRSNVMIFIIMLCFCIVSCDNFLAENPKDMVTKKNYYQTKQDAISAVNSIYAYLGSYSARNTAGVYHSTFWLVQDLASGNMKNNQPGAPYFTKISKFAWTAENPAFLEMWRIHYKAISLANIAIAQIPNINMDESLKERLIHEAKFLRGLLYFNLVRMFGSIPLITKANDPLYPEQAPVDKIYAQIIEDLKAAEKLPPAGQIQEGRATRGAAKSILAKVYLTRENYKMASKKAFQVIQSGNYGLWENYEDVYKLKHRGGKEAIFSVGFGTANGAISFWEVGQFNVRLLPAELSKQRAAVSNTHGWQYATDNLYGIFSDKDERRPVTFMTEFKDDEGNTIELEKVYIRKYWDDEAYPAARDSKNDFQVVRYSDILLIYAEAQAELGNFSIANTYLNKVRNRANLPDKHITNIQDFKEAILLERRREFVAEGKRWFTLVRMGKLREKVKQNKGITVDPRYTLFPIPQEALDRNPKLEQNPGY